MQKKVFMEKNLPKRNRSYVKVLLWAAVALVLLVIVTPWLTKKKGGEEAPGIQKPSVDKGAVVKEIPRPPEPVVTPGDTRSSPPKGLVEQPRPLEPAEAPPEEAKETAAGGKAVDPGVPAYQRSAAEPVTEAKEPFAAAPQSARDFAQPPRPGEVQKPQMPPESSAAGVPGSKDKLASIPPSASQKGRMEEPAGLQPEAPLKGPVGTEAKPTPKAGPLWAVQVGTFKERKNAEEMRTSLQKRGYQVVMKSFSDPKLGQVYVVRLKPVNNLSKASTMLEQVKNEQKGQAIIVKLPHGE